MPQFTSGTISRHSGKWLVITGVFELVLAGIFLVAALAVPAARGGFLLTGVILGVVGLGLLYAGVRARGHAERVQRIEATGLPGTATVLGFTQTGMSVNDNPQIELDLQVDVPGRGSFRRSYKEFIPVMMMARLTPGSTVPIKVDPQDPTNMIIDWQQAFGIPGVVQQQGYAQPGAPTGAHNPYGASTTQTGAQPQQGLGGVPFAAMAMPVAMGMGAAARQGASAASLEQLREHLRRHGTPGRATIESATDTGVNVGTDRLYSLELNLDVPGQAPRRTQQAAMVPSDAVGKVRQGASVPVRIDPNNPGLMMVDWDSA